MWPKVTLSIFRPAVQNALVCLLAYLAGFHLSWAVGGAPTYIGALWATISGIVVLQGTRRATIDTAWLRVLGTLIGSIISALYLSLLPFSPLGMATSIGIAVLLCNLFGFPDHARLAALTVAVIMVVSIVDPKINPLINAGLRFAESCIGTGLAVLAVVLWPEGDQPVER